MADEPDNTILRLPREMRTTQFGHGERLELIERRIDEVHETVYTAACLAAHTNVRHDGVAERLEALEQRVERLEEKA